MAEFFCLPRVEASWALAAGLTKCVDGIPIEASDLHVYPCITVVVMGWTWAFRLIQRAHLHLLRRACVPLSRTALGGWPFLDVRGGAIAVPYCDNVTIIGTCASEVLGLRNRVLKVFESAGFSMHEVSAVESEASVLVLGCDLGGDVPHSRRKGARAWLLRQALAWLASGPRVTGRHVEVIIGHYVAASLYNRVGLCVMRSLYNFVRDQHVLSAPLWRSCRYEC